VLLGYRQDYLLGLSAIRSPSPRRLTEEIASVSRRRFRNDMVGECLSAYCALVREHGQGRFDFHRSDKIVAMLLEWGIGSLLLCSSSTRG
jgi:hypothetical protein